MDYAVTYVIEPVDDSEYYNVANHWPITDEFITWPSRNNSNPTEYFDGNTAWSTTLNPEIFSSITNFYGINVKLTRTSDGKTWNFSYGSSDGYFNINTEGYAYDNCIIFRPNGVGSYNDGDKYHVEISGLSRKSGASGNITYDVTFGAFSSTETKTVEEEVETVEEVKNDTESLLPITGETTMDNLAEALEMNVEEINFVTEVDSSDVITSEVANTFAESEGFVITTNYATISTETGYNAFKIYLTVAGVIGKSAGDVKIYLAKKSTSIEGGSFDPSDTDNVIEAELFDTDGNTFTAIPDPIIVAAYVDEAGDYSVHLAERRTSDSPSGDTTESYKNDSDSSDSGGCNANYGLSSFILAALTFGIPRVKKRVGHK